MSLVDWEPSYRLWSVEPDILLEHVAPVVNLVCEILTSRIGCSERRASVAPPFIVGVILARIHTCDS